MILLRKTIILLGVKPSNLCPLSTSNTTFGWFLTFFYIKDETYTYCWFNLYFRLFLKTVFQWVLKSTAFSSVSCQSVTKAVKRLRSDAVQQHSLFLLIKDSCDPMFSPKNSLKVHHSHPVSLDKYFHFRLAKAAQTNQVKHPCSKRTLWSHILHLKLSCFLAGCHMEDKEGAIPLNTLCFFCAKSIPSGTENLISESIIQNPNKSG